MRHHMMTLPSIARLFKMYTLVVAVVLLAARVGVRAANLDVRAVPEFEGYPTTFQEDVRAVVSIVAPSSAAADNRGAVALSAVMDRSGSMEGEPLRLVKRSVEFLATRMLPTDQFGVVSYSDYAEEELGLRVEQSSEGVTEALYAIDASGSTNLADGLLTGIGQIKDADLPRSMPKNVFLFSDGQANVGVTDLESVTNDMASALGGSNMAVTTFAFGKADKAYMRAIAEAGRGDYYFIQEEAEIAAAFGKALGGLLTTVAQDIQVALKPLDGTKVKDVLSSGSNLQDVSDGGEGTIILVFNDLFAGERRDIYVDMTVPATDQHMQEILQVELTYIAKNEEQKKDTSILTIVRESGPLEYMPEPIVEVTLLRYETANALDQVAESPSDEEALSIIRDQRDKVQGAAAENEELAALVDALDQAEADIQSGQADQTAFASSAASLSQQRNVGSSKVAGLNTESQNMFASDAAAFVGGK